MGWHGGQTGLYRRAVAAVMVLALAAGAAVSAQEAGGPGGNGEGDKKPIVMTIMDDNAVMLIAKVDGRDVVRVTGRTRLDHGSRSIWTDELEYDEDAGTAVMSGNVELLDHDEDALNLTSRHLRLDLNTEAAIATGGVRFARGAARGAADELHYAEYAALRPLIEAELALRPEAVRRTIRDTLSAFSDDDTLLVLRGGVDMKDGEREFQSEFVILNTEDDALVSLGRSAARLPRPAND